MGNEAENQELQTGGNTAMTTSDSSAALINMIERASTNPEVDVNKLERLWEMYKAERERMAEQAFNAALSQMQAQMPVIREGGKIVHSGKTISAYGRWDEDVLPVIKPILKKHGFGLSFRVDTAEQVRVEAVLSHDAGHSERTAITLPTDTSGSKNAVQAVASSVSYGKRYTAASLLNLEIHGQDDDGQAAGAPKPITEEQVQEIESRIDALVESGKMPESKPFFDWLKREYNTTNLADLTQQAYPNVCAMLERKEKGKASKKKAGAKA